MRGGVHVRVIHNRLPGIAAAMPAKAGRAVRETVFAIEAGAKANAVAAGVFDTGTLVDSIQGTMLEVLRGQVVVGVEYGIYNEMGTWKMPARPYFYPAVERERARFHARMRGLVN